jgi:antitoxin ParD1/3/4
LAAPKIRLSREQSELIDSLVQSGEYPNARAVIGDAIRIFRQRRRPDARKQKALRNSVQAGVDALARGDFIEIEDDALESYLEGLVGAAGRSI